MASLEAYRRNASDGAMVPLGVEEHLDEPDDFSAGIIARGSDLPTDALALEQLEEALGQSVIVAIAAPAHAADELWFRRKACYSCPVNW